MALAEISIIPIGTGRSSDIFRIAGKMHAAALKMGIKRVFTSILVDDRRDKDVTMKSKIASVKKRLKKSAK